MKTLRIYIVPLLLAILPAFGATQAPAQQVKATATLDSTNILLGDQINLRLEIIKPENLKVQFPQVPDTLAGKIEVLKRSSIDTLKVENETFRKLVQTYLITCFDSGEYRLPPFRFITEANGRLDSVATSEVVLKVHSMPIDTSRGPTDIKMPYGAPLTLKEVTPYLLGIILIGSLLFLILYSVKRKKKKMPLFARPPKPKEPAHVIALRELDRIRDEKLWQKDKIKEYYSQVTDVLRSYIEERFGIPAMEQTSDETLSSFRSRRELLSDKSLNHLDQILSLADLVKFAKYHPLPDDHNLTLVNAYFFVDETKKEEPKKPEKTEPDSNGAEEVELK